MIKPNITPQDVVDLLNEAMAKDSRAITELYNTRVEVNYSLWQHPTIQVRKDGEHGEHTLSFLGLINGMFGVNDNHYGPIFVEVDDADQDKIKRFGVFPE